MRSTLWIVVIGSLVGLGLADEQPKVKKAAPKPKAVDIDPWHRPEGSIVNQSARFYVWYDKQGWHVRSTAKVGRAFAGVIRFKDAKVKSCVPIGLRDGKQRGAADTVKFNDERNNVKFSFRTGQLSDGIDLVVDGEDALAHEATAFRRSTGTLTLRRRRSTRMGTENENVEPALLHWRSNTALRGSPASRCPR